MFYIVKNDMLCFFQELEKQNVAVEEFSLNASNTEDQEKQLDKKDECNIHKSLMSLIDELSEEVKSLQENVVSQLQFDTVTDTSNIKLTSGTSKDRNEPGEISFSSGDGPLRDVQESYVKTGKGISAIPDDEITINLDAAIKELEKENESLRIKLEKESQVTEQVISEINVLKQTLSFVKTHLQTSNENFVTGTLNVDAVNTELTPDNDLLRELNLCVKRLYKTKYDLNSVEGLIKSLENNIEKCESEIEVLKTENNRLLTSKDHLHKEVTAECNTLKQQLLSLQKENNSVVIEKESLILEINNLKSRNEIVENEMKKVLTSVSNLEQNCNVKQQKLENSEENFNQERIIMQDNISKLEMEVEDTKENLEKAEAALTLLKNENNDIVNEKNMVLGKLDEVRIKLETSEQNCKEIEDELSQKRLLKEKDDNCIASEKGELYKTVCMLEENLKIRNQDLALATQAKDLLSEELASLRKDYDTSAHEKNQIQNKILNLEQELETCKYSLLATSETNKALSDELLALKKYQDECHTQNKELENEVFALTIESENYKTKCLNEDKVRQNLIQELESIKKINENLNIENNSLLNKLSLLEGDIISSKANMSSKLEVENKLAEELAALKNEMSIKTVGSIELQGKYDKLLKECSESKQEYMHLLDIKNKLSDQLISVTNWKDELNVERNNLQNKVEILTSDFKNLEENLENVAKSKQKLSEELVFFKNRDEIVNAEKLREITRIEELETEIKSTKKDMLSTLDTKNKLFEEVKFLKTEIEDSTKENQELQEKLNSSLKELDKTKTDNADLLLAKNQLVEEVASLRIEYKEQLCLLKETKEKLEHQQKTYDNAEKYSSELTQQLSRLEHKCLNMENQNQENILLKTDLESLHKKINEQNSEIEKHSLEKQHVNSILKKLTDVSNIKNLQENLLECVLKFRTEICSELNYLKTKVAVDLMDEANSILQENKRNNELEFKRKDEIDTYNSKIKYFEEKLQKSNKDPESLLYNQTITDSLKGKECYQPANDVDPQGEKGSVIPSGDIEDISKLNDKATFYQKKLYDVEINLKQAYTILKCLSYSLLMRDSDDSVSYNGDGLIPITDDSVSVNHIEQSSVQKQLAALKQFLKEYEEKQIVDMMDLSTTDPNSVTSLLDNNNDSVILKSEVSENFSVTNATSCYSATSDGSKIKQLLHEMQVKDVVIRELKVLVEEYEKQKVMSSSENSLGFQSLNFSEINDSNKCSVDKHNNYTHLEEENKSLLQKIQQLQKSHESTMKIIKAEYEELLEEKDERINIREKEESGTF